jgi:hypothetical protein
MSSAKCVGSSTNEDGKVVYHIQATTEDGDLDLLLDGHLRFSDMVEFAAKLKSIRGVTLPSFPSKWINLNRQDKLDLFFRDLSAHKSSEVQRALEDYLTRSLGDPFDLVSRFCTMHATHFATAMAELKEGRKKGCWSWYIFPVGPWVVGGQEHGSSQNKRYCLRDQAPHQKSADNAARAYLRFKKASGVHLRGNYITIMSVVADQLESGGCPSSYTHAPTTLHRPHFTDRTLPKHFTDCRYTPLTAHRCY